MPLDDLVSEMRRQLEPFGANAVDAGATLATHIVADGSNEVRMMDRL